MPIQYLLEENWKVLSQASSILWHTLDPNVNPEQISSEFVRVWILFRLRFFGASDEQFRAGERWAGNIACWQVDDASDDTVGRYPNDLGTTVTGMPNVTLDIHGMSVGVYPFFVQVKEQSFVGNCSGLSIIVERVYVLHRRVGQEHCGVAGVPGDAIRNGHLLVHGMQCPVVVESEEHTFLREFTDLRVDKRLDPEPSLSIDSTVVRSQSVPSCQQYRRLSSRSDPTFSSCPPHHYRSSTWQHTRAPQS